MSVPGNLCGQRLLKMADQNDVNKDLERETDCSRDSLREFVIEACSHEAQQSLSDDSGLDSERMNQFLQRALDESKRMSNEVAKSRSHRFELHKELGEEMFESWTQDHASQVLSSAQYQQWCAEEKKEKIELEKLKDISQQEDNDSDDTLH